MRQWARKIAETLLPDRQRPIKLFEETPLRFHWDIELLKQALRICLNNNFTHIPTPDELRAQPSLWVDDILRLNEAVRFQLDHMKGTTEPEG